MPLYRCEKCGCIEDTAYGNYWTRDDATLWPDQYIGKALCSECGPPQYRNGEPAEFGVWHGKFAKRPADGMLLDQNGHLWDEQDRDKIPQHLRIVGTIGADLFRRNIPINPEQPTPCSTPSGEEYELSQTHLPDEKMEIRENRVVKLNFKLTLPDGVPVDSTEGKEPLEFIFGIDQIIPGLEEGIRGLIAGDKRTINVASENAYGQKTNDAIREVPRSHFPEGIPLEAGMQLAAMGPDNQIIPVVIAAIQDDAVLIDFNHPLAGKDLRFEVEIIGVRKATGEEISRALS